MRLFQPELAGRGWCGAGSPQPMGLQVFSLQRRECSTRRLRLVPATSAMVRMVTAESTWCARYPPFVLGGVRVLGVRPSGRADQVDLATSARLCAAGLALTDAILTRPGHSASGHRGAASTADTPCGRQSGDPLLGSRDDRHSRPLASVASARLARRCGGPPGNHPDPGGALDGVARPAQRTLVQRRCPRMAPAWRSPGRGTGTRSACTCTRCRRAAADRPGP
jgi:hypothetical protein